mgnify:CR=1 FL=1
MQRNDILKLLFETPYEALRERADEVRAREKGEHVFVRILEPLRTELPILRPAFGESVPETLPS